MPDIPSQTDIGGPAEKIFDLIIDFKGQERWLAKSSAFRGTTEVSSDPVTLGTTYREPGPLGVRNGTVTEFERPTSITFHQPMTMKLHAGTIDVTLRYTLTASGESTHVSRVVTIDTPWPLRVIQAVIVRSFRVESSRTLLALKAYVDASLPVEQAAEGAGVSYGIRVTVVVEVGEHVVSGRAPFPYPVRPPHQVGVLVGARVEVIMIRAVQPEVDEVGGGPQDARQVRAAHNAVGGAVRGEQREDVLAVPAGVPEFHRDPDPGREQPEEIGQPGVVALVSGRELDQQHRSLVTELVPARLDPRDPGLGPV
jgi:uncharacterized protein YndB with AHSA1/START domain